MVEKPPVRKFMFDLSFDGSTPANRPPAERKPVTLKADQLDALKKESYDSGFSAGKEVAADIHAQNLTALLNRICGEIIHLVADSQNQQQEKDEQLRRIILAIAKKVLPEYTTRYGLQEIQKVISDTITEMVHEPRLVVRINQQQFDVINSHIHEITVQKAYAGKVVVLADTDIAIGDCRIEWADGGLERNTQAIWDSVKTIVTPEVTQQPSQE